jgi:hypothetical protein
MRNLILIAALLICTTATADEDRAPSVDQVIDMMAKLPPEGCLYSGKACKPGGYDRGPQAREIAAAIARHATGEILGSRQQDAALLATFSSFESGNDVHAAGDHGKSHGPLQIKYVPQQVAENPDRAVPIWIALARDGACAGLPTEEKLAGLAGSCASAKARQKVRQRVMAARALVQW